MGGWTRRLVALLAILLTTAVCADDMGEGGAEGLRPLRLGSSVYTLMLDAAFVRCDLTQADVSGGMVSRLVNGNTGLELDVYQFGKEEPARGLEHFTLEQANAEKGVEVVRPSDVINDINVGWYWTRRTRENGTHEAAVYNLDSGDIYVQLVFWSAGEEVGMDILNIVDSLRYMELVEIPLGDSTFTLTVPDDFRQGASGDAEDGAAHWCSDATPLSFDVRMIDKAGKPENLSEFARAEAASRADAAGTVTEEEINLTPVVWYRAGEGGKQTLTCIFDGGDRFIEVVFCLDGVTAGAEADYIIHNLIDESLAEVS